MKLGGSRATAIGMWAIAASVVAAAAITSAREDHGEPASAVGARPLNFVPDSAGGFFRCDGLEITWRSPSSVPSTRRLGSLRVEEEESGRVLFEVEDERAHFSPAWCGDILGDGSRSFAYSSFSGGAHCCTTNYVVLLEDSPEMILKTEPGEGGPVQPKQLDEQGPYELVGVSDALAYFDPGGGRESLSFVASPMLPMVYMFDGQQFVEATRRFPEIVEDDLREVMAELIGDVEASEHWEYKASLGLQALADLALVGRLQEGVDDLQSGKWGIDATTSLWLVESIPALEAAIDADFE